jgi:hypothetical protein
MLCHDAVNAAGYWLCLICSSLAMFYTEVAGVSATCMATFGEVVFKTITCSSKSHKESSVPASHSNNMSGYPDNTTHTTTLPAYATGSVVFFSSGDCFGATIIIPWPSIPDCYESSGQIHHYGCSVSARSVLLAVLGRYGIH